MDEVNKKWLGGELNFYFRYKRKIIERLILGKCINVGCGEHKIPGVLNKDVPEIDACRMPYENESFDTVILSDVIEHIEDWKKAVNEAIRIAGKKVIITVPAHMYLWSNYDKSLGHYRRYEKKDFDKFLKDNAGIEYGVSYLFGPTLPLLWARKFTSGNTPRIPRFADNMLYSLSHLKLPFGSTILLEINKK